MPRPGKVGGYLWAAAAIVFWGAMFPVGRSLMDRAVLEPSTLAMMRYLLAAPILAVAGIALHGRDFFPRKAGDWISLSLLGLVGASMMALLLFIAQKTIPSVNASLLESYVPIQVLVMTMCAGHKASGREIAGIVLGFVGSLMVLRVLPGFDLGSLGRGDLLIFVSGLCWAVYTVCGRPVSNRMGGVPFTTWTVFFGGVWLLVYNVATGTSFRLPSATADWWGIAFLATCPTALAFLGWNKAQEHLPVRHLSFMEYFTPLVAAITAVIMLNEPITLLQWLGTVVIIFSAALL